ncbi:hypothetical protein Glove_58g44 [Diversispora epigaea]|uniref:Uncharacterized protein n=1 Tax=Diversispora epigaea TaxID=1348612 RepID=A0A397JGH8_9GLOM|nr:hypothetical protein Glove_58g44 [Diversispora epigaea]
MGSKNLMRITNKIDKSISESFAHNIRQLKALMRLIKKKRKWSDGEGLDYFYGTVTSAREWYFLLQCPGKISLSMVSPFIIEYPKEELKKYDTLCKNKVAEDEPENKKKVEEYCENKLIKFILDFFLKTFVLCINGAIKGEGEEFWSYLEGGDCNGQHEKFKYY